MPKTKTAFVDYLESEVLCALGATCKSMFGGWGVYAQGKMFGLVADDVLYLKTDATSAVLYEAQGLEAFSYESGAKTVQLSYRRAPDVLEDWEALRPWVETALAVALRAKTKKSSKKTQKQNEAKNLPDW